MSKLILFCDNQIILTSENNFIDKNLLNKISDLTEIDLITVNFNQQDIVDYFTCNISSDLAQELLENHGIQSRTIRSLLLSTDLAREHDKLQLITRAKQLAHWSEDHKFCGRCGIPTISSLKEHAKICQQCGIHCYPKLNPCILVAIMNGQNILLGRSSTFPPGVYSLLAGFVEVGESAEDTVHREVLEEVSVKVKNLKYFGSQSWPFPHSLMLAFTAEYESGDIKVDTNELEDARWFDIKKLKTCPELLPAKGSLSRMVLDKLIYD